MTIATLSSPATMSRYDQSLKELRGTRKNIFQRICSGSKDKTQVKVLPVNQEALLPIEDWSSFATSSITPEILTSSDLHQAVSDVQEKERSDLLDEKDPQIEQGQEIASRQLLLALDALSSLSLWQDDTRSVREKENSDTSNEAGARLETLKDLLVLRSAIAEVSAAYSSANPSTHHRKLKKVSHEESARPYGVPSVKRKPAPRYRPESFEAVMKAADERKIAPCGSVSPLKELHALTDGLLNVQGGLTTAKPLHRLAVDCSSGHSSEEEGAEVQYFVPPKQRSELLMVPRRFTQALPVGARQSRTRKTVMANDEKVKSYLYVKSAQISREEVKKSRRITVAPALTPALFSHRSDGSEDDDDDCEDVMAERKNSLSSNSDEHACSTAGERDSLTGDSSSATSDDHSTAPSSIVGSASPQSVKSLLSACPSPHLRSSSTSLMEDARDASQYRAATDAPPMRPRRHPDRSSVSLADSYFSASSDTPRSISPPPFVRAEEDDDLDSYVIDYHQYMSSCDETPRPGALQFHTGD